MSILEAFPFFEIDLQCIPHLLDGGLPLDICWKVSLMKYRFISLVNFTLQLTSFYVGVEPFLV